VHNTPYSSFLPKLENGSRYFNNSASQKDANENKIEMKEKPELQLNSPIYNWISD
jgi:hypothetical protein